MDKSSSVISGSANFDPSISSAKLEETDFTGYAVVPSGPEEDSEKRARAELVAKLQTQICNCEFKTVSLQTNQSDFLLGEEAWVQWQTLANRIKEHREAFLALTTSPNEGSYQKIEEVFNAQIEDFQRIEGEFFRHLNGHSRELTRRFVEIEQKTLAFAKLLESLKVYELVPNIKAYFGLAQTAFSINSKAQSNFRKTVEKFDQVYNKIIIQELLIQAGIKKKQKLSCYLNEAVGQNNSLTVSKEVSEGIDLYCHLVEEGWNIFKEEVLNCFVQVPKQFKFLEECIQSVCKNVKSSKDSIKSILKSLSGLQESTKTYKEARTSLDKEMDSKLAGIQQLQARLNHTYSLRPDEAFALRSCIEFNKQNLQLEEAFMMLHKAMMDVPKLNFNLNLGMLGFSDLSEFMNFLQVLEATGSYSDDSGGLMHTSSSSSSSVSSGSNSSESPPNSSPPKSPLSLSPSSSPEKEPARQKTNETTPLLANRTAHVVPRPTVPPAQQPILRQPVVSTQLRSIPGNVEQPDFACCVIS